MSGSAQKRQSIRGKLTRTVVAVSLLSIFILGAVAMTGVFQMRARTLSVNADMGNEAAKDSRQMLEDEALSELKGIAQAKAETVDAKLQSIMSQVDILAGAAEELYAAPGRFGRIPVYPADAALQGTYTAQIVYSERTDPAAVADEVGLIGNLTVPMKRTSEFLAGAGTTQIGTESGFIVMCDENSSLKVELDHLEPTERGWYRMAADSGAIAWSDVFVDAYGRGLAVTCGKPVYGPAGELKGVVSIGSQLNDISSSVTDAAIGETGYAFVVDQSGNIIISGKLRMEDNGSVTLENLLEDSEPTVREAAARMVAGEEGVAKVVRSGAGVYMAYQPMKNVPWCVVTVMDEAEVLAPSVEGEKKISALSAEAGGAISRVIQILFVLFFAAVVVAVAVAVVLGTTLSKRITRPLDHLIAGVKRISGGDLDTQLEVDTNDEIETLAQAFNHMTGSIKNYIRDLTEVTAEKERIGAELNVATQIQASMLPCIFPAFPEYEEFDIYATMEPAKEVGGDFYDFFLVDERHLGVVMADVSGKGVPAALFMVIAKTLIKNHAQNGERPADVLTNVNNQLCENNEAGMFVTGWMAVLDVQTGELIYANAGHNPPLLKRGGGGFEYLHADPGFVLAGLEGMEYAQARLTLEPGDMLYLYTDGVTEATDLHEELYGEERLQRILNAEAGLSLTELLPAVKADIDAFVGAAPQFDDITMLALRFRGGQA